MKKSFFALAYSLRKFIKRREEELPILLFVIWIIISFFIGWNTMENFFEKQSPTEEDFQVYETVLSQIKEDGLENVTIPDNAKVTISQESMSIKNEVSYYSVTVKIDETKEGIPERNMGNAAKTLDKIMAGVIVLVIFAAGGLVFILIFGKVIKLITKILYEIKYDYKNRKAELDEEGKNNKS